MMHRVRWSSLAGLAAVVCFLSGCSSNNSGPATPTPRPTLHASGPKSIAVVSSNIPTVIQAARHPKVLTINVKVTGVAMDVQALGGTPHNGQGHIQVYLDRIPAAAYRKVDLTFPWLFLVASTSVNFRLPAPVLKSKPGPHRFLLALARNNDVLYRVPPAAVNFTLK